MAVSDPLRFLGMALMPSLNGSKVNDTLSRPMSGRLV